MVHDKPMKANRKVDLCIYDQRGKKGREINRGAIR